MYFQPKTIKEQWALLLVLLLVAPCLSKTAFANHGIGVISNDATTTLKPSIKPEASATRDISIGPCTWVINRKCPDKDIKFYLYTQQNIMDRQLIHIDETLDTSNLTSSFFNPKFPSKIIIHGYNSDMFLSSLQKMRQEYFLKGNYNIFYVDWSILSPGPCYISAVHNTRHAGACVAKLVNRILDTGSRDLHVIGFSLGAQLANYIAQNLDSFLLPRITGLDPAMPLFITAQRKDKLDESDAAFVDIIHTNALVQGKLERCGHVDFYMNGGIVQPGCSADGSNPFACSHQRASAYFLESIRSSKGFWGWACSSYLSYMLGMCPPTNYLVEAGESARTSSKGMFLVPTNDSFPFALGKWNDLPMLGVKQPILVLSPPKQRGDPLLKQVDLWGKLESNFNNIEDPFTAQDYVNDLGWSNYVSDGTSEISVFETNVSIEEQDSVDIKKALKNEIVNHSSQEPVVHWEDYRNNLTAGFIDNNIFQMPFIKNVFRGRRRG